MKLYNSLSKKIEDLPSKDTLEIYSCGPTVYNDAHIGNLVSFIYADLLARSIRFFGYNTKHIMNLTDVDDKTITKSLQPEFTDKDPIQALKNVTGHYETLFLQDLSRVGVAVDQITFIRATDYIEQMKSQILAMLTQKIAYAADDGVYLSIDAYRKAGHTYGVLHDVSSSSVGQERISNDEYDKDSVHDFALWKTAKTNEPVWEFVINGKDLSGRPGWHIECSAMAACNLNTPFDVHTGGVDLEFPHHENEIAQFTATGAGAFCASFFHNQHLLVEGSKMSKSAGNFYTLADFPDKDAGLALRLLALNTHYRTQLQFSKDDLNEALKWLQSFRAAAVMRYQTNAIADIEIDFTPLKNDLQSKPILDQIHVTSGHVLGANLAIPNDMLLSIDKILGLQLLELPDINTEQKDLIATRLDAKNNKDWSTSDAIRLDLQKQGIGLRDSQNESFWFYTSLL